MADETKTPAEVIDNPVSTEVIDNPDGNGEGVTATPDNPEAELDPEFYDPKLLEAALKDVPDSLKGLVESQRKEMQKAFNKAMSSLPKKYRTPEAVQALIARAEKSGSLEQEIAKLKSTPVVTPLPTKPEPVKEEKIELKPEDYTSLIPDATDDDKAFMGRYTPVFNKLISGIVSKAVSEQIAPVKQELDKGKEEVAIKNLRDSNPEIDLADNSEKSYLPEVKWLVKENGYSYDDALKIASFEDVKKTAKELEKQVGLTKKQDLRPQPHVASGRETTHGSDKVDFDKLSIEEKREYLRKQGAVQED